MGNRLIGCEIADVSRSPLKVTPQAHPVRVRDIPEISAQYNHYRSCVAVGRQTVVHKAIFRDVAEWSMGIAREPLSGLGGERKDIVPGKPQASGWARALSGRTGLWLLCLVK